MERSSTTSTPEARYMYYNPSESPSVPLLPPHVGNNNYDTNPNHQPHYDRVSPPPRLDHRYEVADTGHGVEHSLHARIYSRQRSSLPTKLGTGFVCLLQDIIRHTMRTINSTAFCKQRVRSGRFVCTTGGKYRSANERKWPTQCHSGRR